MTRELARHARHVVITETEAVRGDKILCAWADCERYGYDLYKVVVDYGAPGRPYVTRYVFCSERHRAYFVHSHRENGRLPSGSRRLLPPR